MTTPKENDIMTDESNKILTIEEIDREIVIITKTIEIAWNNEPTGEAKNDIKNRYDAMMKIINEID